jgi:hypothetical protein
VNIRVFAGVVAIERQGLPTIKAVDGPQPWPIFHPEWTDFTDATTGSHC